VKEITARTVRASAVHRARRLGRRLARGWDPVRDLFDPGRSRYFPADPDALEGYREHFTDSARAFDVFLRRGRDLRSGNDGEHVAIVVMPWFGTPSPWYAVALGLGLAGRGHRVTFVWHDLPFTRRNSDLDLQNVEIGRVLRGLRHRFPVLRVSGQRRAPCAEPGDAEVIDELVQQNLTWVTRGAVALAPREQRLADEMREGITNALPRVRSLMRAHDFDVLVVPGGVLLASGVYLQTAREHGVRAATFDAGLGWTVVCTSGVAAQQTDLTRAFAMLPDEPGGRGLDIINVAREEFERRRAGTDATSYQHASAHVVTGREPKSILVPLSVVFDTAALGRHHIFTDSREWLVETIAMVLRATDDPVIVRQHPSERRAHERSRFDARAIVAQAFASNPQVQFVPAEDPSNTYDLLQESRLVLPFVSTIGIEAAALGKPVVVGGSVYYANLGFVWAPSTRDEYFSVLVRGARGELPELRGQRDLAWRCYYLNAVCQRVWTDFTCQPPDYWRWVRHEPHELFDEPEVDDILMAIEDDVPVPILRHRRLHALNMHTRAVRPSRTD
jgi:Capsule polysaccharide biosynthesis protein